MSLVEDYLIIYEGVFGLNRKYKGINTRNIKLWLFWIVLTVLFAVIGYNFRPVKECDIYNYRFYLLTYEGITFRESIGKTFSFSYLFNVWFWLISKTGDIYLLSATSCLFVYGICIYIYTDYFIKHKKSSLHYISGLIFLIGNLSFVQIASSIRNFVAIAIVCLAIYIAPRKKKLSAILWISAIFIHSSIAILLILFVFYQHRDWFLKSKRIIWICLFAVIIGCVFIWGMNNSVKLMELVEKYVGYFSRKSFASSLYYIVKKIYSYSLAIIGCILSRHKGEGLKDRNISEMFRFFVLIEILTYIVPDQIYSRFLQGMIIFMALSLIYNKKFRDNYQIEYGMICSGFLGFALDSYLLIHLVG